MNLDSAITPSVNKSLKGSTEELAENANFSKLTTNDIMNRKKTKTSFQAANNILHMDMLGAQFHRQNSELQASKNLKLSFAIQENKMVKVNQDRVIPFDHQESEGLSKEEVDPSFIESSVKNHICKLLLDCY